MAEERVLANWEALQALCPQLRARWLSETEGGETLLERLGGDACVIGYTAADWAQFTAHRTFDAEGNIVPDEEKRAAHQFCFCLRQGPGREYPHVIPMTPEGFRWINENLSNHHIDLVRLLSDDLSGWDPLADPTGRRRRAASRRGSAGGASNTSTDDSTSSTSPSET